MTIVESGPQPTTAPKEAPPIVVTTTWRDRIPSWSVVLGIIGLWIIVWSLTKGHATAQIGGQETTGLHDWLSERADAIQSSDNVFFTISNSIGDAVTWVVENLQTLISTPDFPRPYPQIGWLGVVAIAGWAALAAAGWRSAILVVASFVSFGLLGYWDESIDTLIVTAVSVILAVVIGMPFAIWAGRSKAAAAVITPVLDFFQTFPSFTYLLPLFLLFGLGASAAVFATLLYAFPPMVRIAAHGIRSVSVTSLEATRSLGQTRFQEVTKVQLPMAKRTIIVGINQTTMAALSMVIIAAYVDGPGLGGPVLQALQVVQVGKAFVPGLAIVIMAIMLDRTTTAISERSERLQRAGGGDRRKRMMVLGGTGVAALVAVYVSHYYSWAAGFPESDFGSWLAERVQIASDWISSTFDTQTAWFADKVSYLFLNPMQDLLAESPWFVTAAAIIALAGALGGRWASLTTLVCLGGIYFLDLWYNAMVTLNMTLVATVFVMVLAMVFGVWMGRSRTADNVVRPILDALQTLPPFVYLIPALALFETTRFTAIVAAVAYAAPAAIKIVADGIRGVSATTVEAATAAGSDKWQIIRKVQIPMARGAVLLATNQGLLYVLSMAVIGGLVGAGALGYDIVAGFSQGELRGRGLAASLSVVLIGIMLDRITRRAATRVTS
jgi:glycine betaine/proline transport system permease protein